MDVIIVMRMSTERIIRIIPSLEICGNKNGYFSSPHSPFVGDMFQNPQWTPETMDSTGLYLSIYLLPGHG